MSSISVWMGKPIDSLSLKDLESAVNTVRQTAANYDAKRTEMEKYRNDPHHRYNKMFGSNQLPPVNPLFTKLQNDLESELKRRTGVR